MNELETKLEKHYNNIRNLIIEDEAYQLVKDYSKTRHELMTKYEIGREIIEAQNGEERAKYGSRLVKEFANRLINEVGKKYDYKTLMRCRQYYLFSLKVAPMVRQSLTWTHYLLLMPLKDINEINYYIDITNKQNLTKRQLEERIKSKEYERLPESTKNKLALNQKEEITLPETIKDPIIIYTNKEIKDINHQLLEKIIMEDLTNFLMRLGDGYSFIGEEFQIKIGNRYHYIDMLLFNYTYNSFVVLEIKTGEVTARDKGQIKEYMNYVDENIRKEGQNETYGIIMCKTYDKWIITYFKDDKITVVTFNIKNKYNIANIK